MVRLVVPFILGLVFARSIVPPLWVSVSAALGLATAWLAAASLIRVRRRWLRGVFLFLTCGALGAAWQRAHDLRGSEQAIGTLARQVTGASVSVDEVISTSDRAVRVWGELETGVVQGRVRPMQGRVLLTFLHDSLRPDPSIGDRLLVHARFDTIMRVPDPGGFDVRAWAASYGAYHEAFVKSGQWVILHSAGRWSSLFEGWRRDITDWLKRSSLSAQERGMVKAILLGVRDELDPARKQAFVRSGTIHVLAVSGSHVLIIYVALVYAMRRLGNRRWSRYVRGILLLLALWFYAGVTGFTPSVLRATVTFTLLCVAEMSQGRTEPLNSLAAAAGILLVWDPSMLWQLSFQLSFLAVLGIAIFYRPLHQLWAPGPWWLRHCWSLFCVSIAAQALTTPLSLLTFGAFPVWFIPANLVIVGLVTIGVYGGIALVLLHAVPVVGEWVTQAMSLLLELLAWSSDLFAHLPGAYPDVRIDGWQCSLLYALVLAMAGWLLEGWKQARTFALATAVVLCFTWAWNARARSQEHQFVVYGDRASLSCAVRMGRTLRVFADTLDEWTVRRIEAHQRACGATMVKDTCAFPSMLTNLEECVLFLHPEEAPPSARRFTTVVLASDGRYDTTALATVLEPGGSFVLAPGISGKRRSFLRRWCEEHHLAVHDVRLHGAYVR